MIAQLNSKRQKLEELKGSADVQVKGPSVELEVKAPSVEVDQAVEPELVEAVCLPSNRVEPELCGGSFKQPCPACGQDVSSLALFSTCLCCWL